MAPYRANFESTPLKSPLEQQIPWANNVHKLKVIEEKYSEIYYLIQYVTMLYERLTLNMHDHPYEFITIIDFKL